MENIKKDSHGNVIEGNVVEKNTENSFLSSQNRIIAAIGIKNMIVVETRDAILVANKDQAQEVKNIVSLLNEKKYLRELNIKKVLGLGVVMNY